jgi:hypothetical protein
LFDWRLQYLCCHFFFEKTTMKGHMPERYICSLYLWNLDMVVLWPKFF